MTTWLLISLPVVFCAGWWSGTRTQREQTRWRVETLVEWGDDAESEVPGFVRWYPVRRVLCATIAEVPDPPHDDR